MVLQIKALELSPKKNGSCIGDYVEINKFTAKGNVIRLCGSINDYREEDLMVMSSENILEVNFRSDFKFDGSTGFYAEYYSVQSCSDSSVSSSAGSLRSVAFPLNYMNNQDCRKVITLPNPSLVLEIRFTTLITANGNDSNPAQDSQCKEDFVQIQDGGQSTRWCGNWTSLLYRLVYRSHSSTVAIRFFSNGHVTSAGFEATWKAVANTSLPLPCPQQWWSYGNYCLEHVPLRRSWPDAARDCRRRQGFLATISNNTVQQYIDRKIRRG